MRYRFAWATCFLACALLSLVAATGCAKKDPVTSANSGLRPAGADDEGSGGEDGKSTTDDGDDNTAVKSGDGSADAETSGNGASEKPPAVDTPREIKDELAKVPEGTPAELVAYLDKLDKRLQQLVAQLRSQGRGTSPEVAEVIFNDLKRLMQLRMAAAERILASDEAEAVARVRAVESKLDALNFLEQSGDETAREKIDAFVAELEQDDDAEVRRVALSQTLEAEVNKISDGEQKDPSKVIAQLKDLLSGDAKNLSFEQFAMAQNAAVALLQNEQVDAGVEVMKLMGDAFSGSSEPELAERAKSMMEQAQAIALQHASQQLQAGDEGALERLMATAKAAVESDTVQVQPLLMITQVSKDLEAEHPDAAKELSALAASGLEKLVSKENQDLTVLVTATRLAEMMDPPNEEIIAKANELVLARVEQDVAAPGVTAESLHQMLSEVAMQAEFSGDVELASKLYDAIGAAAAKIEDAEEIKGITQQLEAAKKRVGMVGKPLVVEGKLLDGQPFDWKPYEGKVVLVDFWATWCGPCIREFPNIKENYEAYHEQGFEVVGVNLDDDNKSVESFFEARGELPWTTVVSPDDSARGFNTPLAQASGVTAIPFVVLVGKDGNVEAIHVRGEQLGERLAKIFGPPPTSDVPETNIVPDDVPESVPEETPPEAPEDEPADAPATEPVPE